MEIRKVTRVRDADGAKCLDCDAVYDTASHLDLPMQWTWRKSQAMHEGRVGGSLNHHMVMFAYVRTDA